MGGMVVGWAQAHFKTFDAVVLLGSGPFGLASHLPDPLRSLADDPACARAEIVSRVREMGLPAYMDMASPDGSPNSMFPGGNAQGLAALRAANAPLLCVPGFFVLIPGSWAPEAAAIQVPLLLVYGDGDILSDPHSAPAWFKSCTDITVVTLPDTGHIHFVFNSMPLLTRRVSAWIQAQINHAP
jgi:pimeloyl-ACP methyl ester carboxylesterase